MSTEIKARIERLVSVFENRILVIIVLVALAICAGLSFYTLKDFSGDTFDPLKGDRAVITYEVTYYGIPATLVATWLDKDGITHYATENPKLAGFDVALLILFMIILGLAKASYDTYAFLTERYRRWLIARFQYRFYTK